MAAKYWICQHIPDPFRNEPRNVGVIVQFSDEKAGRFFGEISPEQIDGRKLSKWAHGDVYRQWVAYWRRELPVQTIDCLIATSGSNYRVVEGGEVTDIGSDSIDSVLGYLYGLLVEGGFAEVFEEDKDSSDKAAASLEDEIEKEFSGLRILARESSAPVRHPIRRNQPISGSRVLQHRPAFSQNNGTLYVVESVDFASSQKKRARDKAGWSAYMFRDIREAHPGAVAMTIVRVKDEDQSNDDVHSGLLCLESEGQIINWSRDIERKSFLSQRQMIANQL
jgi:hypothetical protein